MTNKTLTAGVKVFSVLVVALLIVWGAVCAGYALSVLWGWFMVPLFGLPVLSVAQAYGVALVVQAAKGYNSKELKFGGSGAEALASLVFAPPLVYGLLLSFGWVAKAWV